MSLPSALPYALSLSKGVAQKGLDKLRLNGKNQNRQLARISKLVNFTNPGFSNSTSPSA